MRFKTMENFKTVLSTLLVALMIGAIPMFSQAQDRNDIQYYVPPTQEGLNEFEAPFTTDKEFDGVEVRLGGSNTLQFQGITHDNAGDYFKGTDENDNPIIGPLPDLENNFNLATSNLDFDVALANGMRMHLRTYLSSRHHAEAWVKGGYLQVDRLDFIQEDFMADLMDHLRIKVGHMEFNYGDNHFRRSDNGAAISNPFVGNYLMDSFTTEVAGEVYYFTGDFFGMIGLTNGKLNQSTVEGDIKTEPTIYGKLGYDSQVNEDLRVRLTGSILNISQSPGINLYSGDRAGARYYNVMDGGFRSGRIVPDFNPGYGQPAAAGEMTAIMINPFVKYKGLEFYGVFENASGQIDDPNDESRSYTQLGAELLYRFGPEDDIYFGGRYNSVSGEQMGGNDIDVSRLNLGGGYFMTKNVLTKVEYVTQSYDGFSGRLEDGEFSGVMVEAVVSF